VSIVEEYDKQYLLGPQGLRKNENCPALVLTGS